MDASNGSDDEPLTEGAVDVHADYSGDGRLVFVRYYSDTHTDIVVQDLESGDETVILDSGYNLHPNWSPDDRKIAFDSADCLNCVYHIYTMNPDGSDIEQLTLDGLPHGWTNVTPAWSPDGTRIAFGSDRAGSKKNQLRDIFVMNADGSNQVNLTHVVDGRATHPTWSAPNGSYISYHHAHTDGTAHLYIMKDDGANIIAITDSNEGEFAPAWSPDGTQIAFDAQVDGSRDVYVMNVPSGCVNGPPSVTADSAVAIVGEGQEASNSGLVSDPDGDLITLVASIGAVTSHGDGTWSWSHTASDGPADSQLVVIYADDSQGGESQVAFDLQVNNMPPDLGPITAPVAPVEVGVSMAASASFTDPGTADTHTAEWDWGDGSQPEAGTVTQGAGFGSVADSHIYAEPGVYTIRLTVTDNDGDSDEEVYKYVVIYDPEGGFVTGGGWIWSEAGWCQLDEVCAVAAGKANFGLVSKYKKGATIPTGSTEFNFSAGGLNFHSSSYDWLVVTGSDYAMFKGVGAINGQGEYKFRVWAGDGDPDTFRIRIWVENELGNETDIYDNGSDQEIEGGAIVIHTK
jgi:PKD repeat protein